MNINYLKMIVAVTVAVLFTGISVGASAEENVRHVSGEIQWVDVKLGKLQLKGDASPSAEEIAEYRITEHETRVTNPSDKKFLSIEDLQPGQHVIIDVINGKEEKIVQKITSDPRPTSNFKEAYGEIEAIDGSVGTFTLAGRLRAGEEGESNLSYFVFDPKNIVAMQSPSRQPVLLQVKPGDVVKVEFVVRDGKQWANSITLYSLKVTSTTTTTTVTTTR